MHDAAKEEAVFNVDVSIAIDIAEAKAVQNCDWPCAHADDVADDAADAGCGAIKWFDIAWVVVRFHLEDDALASVTKRHDACTFECIGILCFLKLAESPEGVSGVLISAVLAPFDSEHIELKVGRDTP